MEPAIFGTLLERALQPRERHKLGAHYTPRAYVERLVMPTVIEPLREEWEAARTASAILEDSGDEAGARKEIVDFHRTAVLGACVGPGLRQRQLSVRYPGAPQTAGRRGDRSAWTISRGSGPWI